MTKGCVIWLTGLPCSGKTSISYALNNQLTLDRIASIQIDGDIFRKIFCKDLGFSKEDREENLRRVIEVAKMYEKDGLIVICSFVSPLKSMRENLRSSFNKFIEVFVDCDLETCIHRDVKGMYAKAINGEIKNFTGISDPYEVPENPEIICSTHIDDLQTCKNQIIEHLKENCLI